MPHPRRRLDLAIVPTDPDRVPASEDVAGLLGDLLDRRWIGPDGQPGPAADAVVAGGFARWRTEDAAARGVLVANGQGGFRVRCPATGTSIVPAFQVALASWRRGGARAVDCPACGGRHPLEALTYAPPAAFARFALVLADVAAPALAPGAAEVIGAHLGPIRTVARRVA